MPFKRKPHSSSLPSTDFCSRYHQCENKYWFIQSVQFCWLNFLLMSIYEVKFKHFCLNYVYCHLYWVYKRSSLCLGAVHSWQKTQLVIIFSCFPEFTHSNIQLVFPDHHMLFSVHKPRDEMMSFSQLLIIFGEKIYAHLN